MRKFKYNLKLAFAVTYTIGLFGAIMYVMFKLFM